MTDEELENEIVSLRAELAETVKKAADNQAMIRDLQEILKNSKHDGEELLDKHVRNAIADLIDKSTEYRERLSKVTKERDVLLSGSKALEAEVIYLKRIISKELTENDELGSYVQALKDDIKRLESQFADAKLEVDHVQDKIRIVEKERDEALAILKGKPPLNIKASKTIPKLFDQIDTLTKNLLEANAERCKAMSERDTFYLTAKLNGEDLFVAKAENARLVAALEDIAGHVCCTPCDNIAEQALTSSTSDKDLLNAIRNIMEVAKEKTEATWHICQPPCDLCRILSALKKALGKEK